MKDVTMSLDRSQARNKRLARRSWLVSCLAIAVGGCAQVSPLRVGSSDRATRPSHVQSSGDSRAAMDAHNQANTRNQIQPSTQSPVNSSLPANSLPPIVSSAAAAQASRVMPVAYEQCMNCPPNMGDAGPLAPIESGPVPPYWNDQEYLYDGGDREPQVQVLENWEVRGLNSQDTIAHYETIDGKLCIAATNRVPIYAPRFGAVRKVAAPILAARAVGAERVVEPTGAVIQQSRDLANNVTMPVGPKKQTNVKLIDGLRDRTRGVPAEKITPLVNVSNPQVAFQHLEGLGTAVRREDLEALLTESIINARTWQTDEHVAVMMGGVEAVELRDAKQVQDVLLYETEPGKCTLRICKAASHSAASPGDVVSFSIRFDNVGDKPIGNLVILDSLTTRLEYIDGSQQCILSLANGKNASQRGTVKFSTSENEAGSTVLRWEADSPLASGDSGVISFRCRVR